MANKQLSSDVFTSTAGKFSSRTPHRNNNCSQFGRTAFSQMSLNVNICIKHQMSRVERETFRNKFAAQDGVRGAFEMTTPTKEFIQRCVRNEKISFWQSYSATRPKGKFDERLNLEEERMRNYFVVKLSWRTSRSCVKVKLIADHACWYTLFGS